MTGLVDKIEVMIAADWAVVTDPMFWLVVIVIAAFGVLGVWVVAPVRKI